MRILVLGGNLAGLLSALQLHRQGDEVCVLVHGPEAALKAMPPMLFTDPGPWVARQSAWASICALAGSRGDFRLGEGIVAHMPWMIRWLLQRSGARANMQSLRALALTRRSKLLYDELYTYSCLLFAAEPLRQISVYERSTAAKAQYERGPVWHMGSSRPSLGHLGDQVELLPALDLERARHKPTLTSGGMMVGNSANVLATLRNHLSHIGVRFIYDHAIESVENIARHIHGVTLRGSQNQLEEVDTDLVVASSLPAAWPLFKALRLKPNLTLLKTLSLRAQIPVSHPSALFLHEKKSGIRLVRQGSTVWAQGPTWLGEPGGKQASEVAQLTGRIAHYFGSNCTLVGDAPLVQTSWVAPDGLPITERTSCRNLFLNIGHHSATAAMAFGSAVILQSLVDQALNIHRATPVPHRTPIADGSPESNSAGQIHA